MRKNVFGVLAVLVIGIPLGYLIGTSATRLYARTSTVKTVDTCLYSVPIYVNCDDIDTCTGDVVTTEILVNDAFYPVNVCLYQNGSLHSICFYGAYPVVVVGDFLDIIYDHDGTRYHFEGQYEGDPWFCITDFWSDDVPID